MDYGQIVSRGWSIVWENKFMIALGFLAALGGNRASQVTNYELDGSEFPVPSLGLEEFLARYGWIVAAVSCVVILLALVFWLVRLVAQAGLIESTARLEVGEQMTFGQAISAGTSKLGRLIGLNVLLYGPFTLVAVLVGGVLLGTGVGATAAEFGGSQADVEAWLAGLGFAAICGLLLACLLAPLLLVVTFVYPFAQRGLVLHGLGVVDSIRHGWRVLTGNLAEILILALIFLVIGLLFGLVSFVVMIPLGFLAALPALGDLFGATGGGIGVAELGLLLFGGACLAVVVAIVNAILVAFRSASFTLAYQEWFGKTGAGD